MESVESRGSN